jgi:hypothetical protein
MPKRSEIAAARLKVALVKARGGVVEPWIQKLADTPLTEATNEREENNE